MKSRKIEITNQFFNERNLERILNFDDDWSRIRRMLKPINPLKFREN